MKNEKNLAFSKGMPSAFIVSSPLQLLCAIEAEHEFEIKEKKYVLVLRPNWPRNEQLISMAKSCSLDYDIVYTDDITIQAAKDHVGFFSDINGGQKYNRIFVGDYYESFSNIIAYKYVCNGTIILYLDDGNASVSVLQGKSIIPRPQNLRKKLHWWRSGRFRYDKEKEKISGFLEANGAICSNCFFTIFYNVKSKKFILYPNSFRYLRESFQENAESKKVVLVVGPIFSRIPEINHIEEEDMEAVFWAKLLRLKLTYPNMPILYIPHGRDTNQHIPAFCQLLGIEYVRISEAVEWFAIKNSIKSIAVFGQCSTALYTLKKLFPEAIVVNWVIDKRIDNPNYYPEKRKAKEYRLGGIEEERILFPISVERKKELLREDLNSIVEWVKSFVKRK